MRGLVGVVLCAAVAAPAHADVVVGPGVPFSAEQLEWAIATRAGAARSRVIDVSAVDVSVARIDEEQLELELPIGRWRIQIGAEGGERAARVVALHVIELGGLPELKDTGRAGDAAMSKGGTGALAAPGTNGTPGGTGVPVGPGTASASGRAGPADAELSRPLTESQGRDRVAMLGVMAHGFGEGSDGSLGLALEVTHIEDRVIIGAGLEWQRERAVPRALEDPVSVGLVRGHAVGGVALGPLELVAGAFAGRIIMSGALSTESAWAFGLEGRLRAALRITGSWSIALSAGVDVFHRRVEVTLLDELVTRTPRTALNLGVGFAWTGIKLL